MAEAVPRRVGGVFPSARRRCLLLLLASLFVAVLTCQLALAEHPPDTFAPPAAAPTDGAVTFQTSPPAALSAAAQAMAAAAERQTEVREVPMATASITAGAARTVVHENNELPGTAQPQQSSASADSASEMHFATGDEAQPTPAPQPETNASAVSGSVLESCSYQLQSPFATDDSCYTAPAPAPATNASSTTPADTDTLLLIAIDSLNATESTASIASTRTVDRSSVNATQQPSVERDAASGVERVVAEPREKKNPIAELKEEVMKHIEEKKREKEKEKHKEQHVDLDGHTGSGSDSSDSTQPAGPATSSAPPSTPSSSAAAPVVPSITAASPAPSAASTSPTAIPAATPAAATPPALIYPSPPPSSIFNRFNYAAYDSGAKLLLSSPGMKKASAILSGDDDSYMMTPCSSAAKYVIVQLKEDILLDLVELVNREHYSSSIQHFSLYGSNVYPTDEWVSLGKFWADETQQAQYWRLDAGDYAVRYVKLIWETWWKDEYYCTLTQLGVYGRSVLEAFREDLDDSAEVLREVEQVLIEHNLAKEADAEKREVKESVDAARDGERMGTAAGAAVVLPEAVHQVSASVSSTSPTSYLWDVVAFWTHQSSVEPVISQLMGVDEPPSIIVTAHSQSTPPSSRLLLTSPLQAPSMDADKLFGQPVCRSFNVSQPVSVVLPRLDAASALSSNNTSAFDAPSDTIIISTETDSDESDNTAQSATAAPAVEMDEPSMEHIQLDSAYEDGEARSPIPTVLLTTTPTTTAATSTPASLFSDFIYSQMARLSKQAGAQSQAEAEKIDPHYAALLAKYTGRDKQRTAQSPFSASSAPHSIDDAAAPITVLSASTPSAATETVALVSAADVHKGKSSSHQSIFRTLTNRLKEVELHQALSTHFVSVLSERFGAEIEQLQLTLEKLKGQNAAHAAANGKAATVVEDREALRAEVAAEVRREAQQEMQRVLDMQLRMEERLAELSAANQSLHSLLHQELLAFVFVLVCWTALSSLLPPQLLRTTLRYLWSGATVLVWWAARVVWRAVAWAGLHAMGRLSAYQSGTSAAEVTKPAHRRSSSVDSSRRPSTSTPAITPGTHNKQQQAAGLEHQRRSKQQRQPQRPSLDRPNNGHAQQHSLLQQAQHSNKRNSPPSSYLASPQPLCTWTIDDVSPAGTIKASINAAVHDDDNFDSGESAFDGRYGEAADPRSARPHLSPPTSGASSRRGSWSGQSPGEGQRTVVWAQQQTKRGGGNSHTQPLPARPAPSPLPPLRPTAASQSSISRPSASSAKHRSRTAEAAQLPSFIHRAMSPPAGATAASAGDSFASAPSSISVTLQPYVSHASINSFDVLLQSPERRNRPMLIK